MIIQTKNLKKMKTVFKPILIAAILLFFNSLLLSQAASDSVIPKKGNLTLLDTISDKNYIEAEFNGNTSTKWTNFLMRNLNHKLGEKYLEIPIGKKSTKQSIAVSFIVDKQGKITNIEIINYNNVHPKLAEEVIRVFNKSPLWQPATFNGVPIKARKKQLISFSAGT